MTRDSIGGIYKGLVNRGTSVPRINMADNTKTSLGSGSVQHQLKLEF